MNEKFKEILRNSGIHHDTHLIVDFNSENSLLEELIKNVARECIAQNVRTSKTMLENELTDHCSPHIYNFEIGQLFGTTVIKRSSEE